MCSMDTLKRKTVNFDQRDSQLIAPFLDADTTEHAALEALVGQPLSSDSAELRALVLLGVQHVREALLEDAYNDAVDAGDFDETADWVRGTRARRRSHD
jgi:hypothetical protein